MPRRTSIVLLSVTAHAVTLSALVVASIVMPGVLPLPHDVLAAPVERVVQLPDIPIPAARRRTTPPQRSDAAPIVAPSQLPVIDLEPQSVPRSDLAIESDLSGTGDLAGIGASIPGDALTPPAPVQQINGPIRLHSGIAAPVKIVDRRPEYPMMARQAGIQGVVIIELTITDTGEVASAHVLRSITLLDQAALEAVRAWRFQPARLNGEPVAVIMAVTVNFQLSR